MSLYDELDLRSVHSCETPRTLATCVSSSEDASTVLMFNRTHLTVEWKVLPHQEQGAEGNIREKVRATPIAEPW